MGFLVLIPQTSLHQRALLLRGLTVVLESIPLILMTHLTLSQHKITNSNRQIVKSSNRQIVKSPSRDRIPSSTNALTRWPLDTHLKRLIVTKGERPTSKSRSQHKRNGWEIGGIFGDHHHSQASRYRSIRCRRSRADRDGGSLGACGPRLGPGGRG